MADVNLRAFVIDQLKPVLPSTWRFFDHGDNLDELSQPTVMLTLESISRIPEAPRSGTLLISYTLSVLEPSPNPDNREDNLDDLLIDVINALDGVPNLVWTDAKRGVDTNGNLGFDISLAISINPEGA